MKNIPYTSVVGSLMYAQVYIRPDIAFAIGMLGRYQSNPSIDHWKAAKKVVRYLQGTKDHMLMYRRTDNLEVIGYYDSDYAGCIHLRKSTLEYVFMLTRWSYFLEKRKIDFDCNFHYGGRVCVLF
ncbi:Retrovirus-related Pol polyprotein from transposon TNT 1-94 [Vitis vinifera]|uniref:Retrovirus-related Pol polyprotein from transposon TNT 1-94 n=1 Tax=Vitis vinifera TaxID=29760 RepID=A0A438FQK4_VITVI|nr:Retrovirus-related Pol polyprotein from transposon TNT 1-94 [Vitis vinifera]